jgi:small subunit ribosomal protein S6
MSRHYEVCIILHPDSELVRSEEKMKKLSQRIQDDFGGVVHRMEDCGNRILKYNIKKCHKARYFLFNIEVKDDAINTISYDLRMDDHVFRHLIVKRKDAIVDQSLLMKDNNADQSKHKKLDFNQSSSKKRFSVKEKVTSEAIDYKNIDLLHRFIMEGARIVPCRISGMNAKMQRAIRTAIIRARFLALLPYCDTHKG